MKIANEILMYFRSNKKYLNDVSLNDFIGVDKDGNSISLIDILPDDGVDLSIKRCIDFCGRVLGARFGGSNSRGYAQRFVSAY